VSIFQTSGRHLKLGAQHLDTASSHLAVRGRLGTHLQWLPVFERQPPFFASHQWCPADTSKPIIAEARGVLPRGEYSGRRLLGSALLAMSSVLAIILALHVAKDLWGPRYARRRARAHWVSAYANANYASQRDLLFWESGQWKRGKSITLLPPRSYVAGRHELPTSHTPVAYSANGEPSSDALHKIVTARRQLRTQRLKAKRPLRAHAKVVTRGVRQAHVVRRPLINRAKRARTLRRTGGI
jgi:hypothetical protein